MAVSQRLKTHADLVDRMSRALEIDLEEEIMRGKLQIETLGDAVLSCTGCANPGACRQWLDTQAQPADASPGYCRNADMFGALKAGRRV